MLIHGPRLVQLEHRAEYIGSQVNDAFDSIALVVGDWYRTFDDINITRTLWLEQVNSTLLPLVIQAYDDSAVDTWEKLNAVGDEAQGTLTAALIPKIVSNLAETFVESAKRRLVAIGDGLWNTMRLQLLQGTQLGENLDKLRARLPQAARIAAPRARNAAQTEIIGASNAGSYQQVKAAQFVALKRWVARNDDRTRSSHRAVDGTQVDMNTKFIVGGYALDYPHDPTAPPEEVYNCRCTLVWDIIKKGKLTDEIVIRSLAADAFHLPGKHDQSDHGHKGSQGESHGGVSPKIKQMMSAYEAGYEIIDEFEPGASNASVQRLRLSDGTEVVRKSNPRNQTKTNAVRAEYLGGLVLNATGVDDMHTAQVDENTTITTFAEGPSSARTQQYLDDLNFNDYQREREKIMRKQLTARNGKAVGIADHLMMNVDRNGFNWIVTDDGIKPIDQGNALFTTPPGQESVTSGSPFAEYWLGEKIDNRTGDITSMKPRVTRDDVLSYRERLNAIRDEFNEPGEDAYFDAMMSRLADVETRLS